MQEPRETIDNELPDGATNKYFANEALKYAKERIIKGVTQLESNRYSLEEKEALELACYDIRETCGLYPHYSLETDYNIYHYYQSIGLSKKYSIGNCGELAFLALDYLVNNPNTEHLNAEIYKIGNGNHIFLVLGRREDSIPEKPETWGEEAYICDPWSNKVYPAQEYLNNLTDYYRNAETGQNESKPFDPNTQSLLLQKSFTAKRMKQANAKEHLNEIGDLFDIRMDSLLQSLTAFKKNSVKTIDTLFKKHGANKKQQRTLSELILKFDEAIAIIQANKKNKENPGDYLLYRKTLENTLVQSIAICHQMTSEMKKAQSILCRYFQEGSWRVEFSRFFKKLPPESASILNTQVENSQEIVDSLSKVSQLDKNYR